MIDSNWNKNFKVSINLFFDDGKLLADSVAIKQNVLVKPLFFRWIFSRFFASEKEIRFACKIYVKQDHSTIKATK